jgi:hypothetical protein
MKQIDLTEEQVRVLKTLLGLDLDAVGLNRKDQRVAWSIRKKLMEKVE